MHLQGIRPRAGGVRGIGFRNAFRSVDVSLPPFLTSNRGMPSDTVEQMFNRDDGWMMV
jgi:hypothetical protein